MHRTTKTATDFAGLIQHALDFELLAPVTTSVVASRFIGTADNQTDSVDRANRDIPAQLRRRGNVFLTATTLRGRHALRACFLNPLVTDNDLRLLIAEIRTVG